MEQVKTKSHFREAQEEERKRMVENSRKSNFNIGEISKRIDKFSAKNSQAYNSKQAHTSESVEMKRSI